MGISITQRKRCAMRLNNGIIKSYSLIKNTMAGSAAKNLAMLMATKTYTGLKSIGKSVRSGPRKMLNRIENVERLKNEKNRNTMIDNFGSEANYKKTLR